MYYLQSTLSKFIYITLYNCLHAETCNFTTNQLRNKFSLIESYPQWYYDAIFDY